MAGVGMSEAKHSCDIDYTLALIVQNRELLARSSKLDCLSTHSLLANQYQLVDELIATFRGQVIALGGLVDATSSEKLARQHHSRLNTEWLCSKIEGSTEEYSESLRLDLVRYGEQVVDVREKTTKAAQQACVDAGCLFGAHNGKKHEYNDN